MVDYIAPQQNVFHVTTIVIIVGAKLINLRDCEMVMIIELKKSERAIIILLFK